MPSIFPPRGARLFLLLSALGGPLPPPLPPHRGYPHPLDGPRTGRPPDYEASASVSSSVMAGEEMRYTTAVGPLPILTDPSTWAPAWAREEARPDVEDTLAHATFRGIDPARPANPFAKQIFAMPHALVPSLDDRASSITVVRRNREAEYRRLYLGFLDDAPADPPLVMNFDYILTSSPFIDVSDSEGPTTAQLTTARNHRGGLTGHLVGCHQAEYSSCATATRSRFCLPTPAWWSGVEFPYSCMAELPWVHAYAADDLYAGRRTP